MDKEFRIKHDVWENPKFKGLKPSEKLVYIELCREYNWWISRFKKLHNEPFFHSEEQLAEGTGLTRLSIRRAKRKLTKLNFIKVSKGIRPKHGRGADFFELCDFDGHKAIG